MTIKQIKRLFLFVIFLVILNGCADIAEGVVIEVVKGTVNSASIERKYTEKIDHEIFLHEILNHQLITNLKYEDVIYIDNYRSSPSVCNKIIFTKDAIYQIGSVINKLQGVNINNLNEYINKMTINQYSYNNILNSTLKNEFDSEYIKKIYKCQNKKFYQSCNKLILKLDRPWYLNSEKIIQHRYNNIHKIKEIIDERVAYFKSLENNETK